MENMMYFSILVADIVLLVIVVLAVGVVKEIY